MEEQAIDVKYINEHAVIAGAILDDGFRLQATRKLTVADFEDKYHRAIWRAVLDLTKANTEVNASAVLKRCIENGYDTTEIRPVIVDAVESLLDITEAKTALEELYGDAKKRKLQVELTNIASKLDELSVEDAVLRLEDVLYKVSKNGKTTTLHVASLIGLSKGRAEHVPVFFRPVREVMPGFEKSNLIVIAGRPSTGKTAFAIQMALEQALNGIPSGFISLEMSSREIVQRLVAMLSGVPSRRQNEGYDSLMPTEQRLVDMAHAVLQELPLYLVFPRSTDFYEITGSIMELVKVHGVKVAYIDYLQLMHVPGRQESRVQEIGHMTGQLKVLARTLDIPIVLLSQLSRAPEHRTSLEPRLSDLRDSGVIEQDADVVWMIHPLFKYGPHRLGMTELGLKKNRNGPVGRVRCGFVPSLTKHVALERLQLQGIPDDTDLGLDSDDDLW